MPKRLKASTADLHQGEFRPHGVIQMEVSGNIVQYLARGPFNKELNTAYGEVQRKSVLPAMASKGPWGDVTVFVDSALESPSSLEEYARVLQDQVLRGAAPAATAFVIPDNVEGAKVMGPLYARIYADAGLRFKVFNNQAEALYWVEKTVAEAPDAAGSSPYLP